MSLPQPVGCSGMMYYLPRSAGWWRCTASDDYRRRLVVLQDLVAWLVAPLRVQQPPGNHLLAAALQVPKHVDAFGTIQLRTGNPSDGGIRGKPLFQIVQRPPENISSGGEFF